MIQFTDRSDGRISVVTAKRGDAPERAIAVPNTLASSKMYGMSANSLLKGARVFVDRFESGGEDLSADGWNRRASGLVEIAMNTPFRETRRAALGERDALSAERGRMLALKNVDPAEAREIRDWLRQMSGTGEAMHAVTTDAAVAAAALGNWRLTGLPAELRGTVEDLLIRWSLTDALAVFGVGGAGDPLGGRRDGQATDAAVDAYLAGLDQRQTDLTDAVTMLNGAVEFTSDATGMNRTDTFNALTKE